MNFPVKLYSFHYTPVIQCGSWTSPGHPSAPTRWASPLDRHALPDSERYVWVHDVQKISQWVSYFIDFTVERLIMPKTSTNGFLDLFTPLRVGWPPAPQVFFGPWQGLRNLQVFNICACYLHLYFKKLRSQPQPRPSRATISPPPWDPPNGCFFIFSPAWPPKLGNFK